MTIAYKPEEQEDAEEVEKLINVKTNKARKVVLAPFDLREEKNCKALVEKHLSNHGGKLDILCVSRPICLDSGCETMPFSILNHGTQQANDDLTNLSSEQWHDVFQTNINSFFYTTKAALPHMPSGSTMVFDASVNPSVGHPELIDYTATKGAIVGFARALSNQIVGEKGIRVNGEY